MASVVPDPSPPAGSVVGRVVAVAGLGVGAVAAAAVGGPWTLVPRMDMLLERPAGGYTPPPTLATPPPDVGGFAPYDPTRFTWMAVALTVAGLVGAVLLLRLLWRRRPRRSIRVEPQPSAAPAGGAQVDDTTRLSAAARRARAELAAEIEPRDAIVRCWLALEQAAAGTTAARRPADSPSELAARVLAATTADSDAVALLLTLYHRARFSTHEITRADVGAARGSVDRLSRSWAGYEQALRATVPGTGR